MGPLMLFCGNDRIVIPVRPLSMGQNTHNLISTLGFVCIACLLLRQKKWKAQHLHADVDDKTPNFDCKHCGKRSSFRALYNFVGDVLSEVGQHVDQLQLFTAVSGSKTRRHGFLSPDAPNRTPSRLHDTFRVVEAQLVNLGGSGLCCR